VNHAPDPAHRRTDETLLKIAPHQLKEKTASFYQIAEKQCPRESHFPRQVEQYQFNQQLATQNQGLTEMH
jgi:hypothetical protein